MKRLRHRLGHWLLRDENLGAHNLHHLSVTRDPTQITVHIDGKAVHRELLKFKRERGGGSLGLS